MNTNGSNLTLTGVVSGSGLLSKVGGNTLSLEGINTFTGGLTVSAGIVATNNDASFGTGTVTLPSGGTGRVNLAGGFTYTNNFVIGSGAGQANVTGNVGLGLINHAGSGRATITGSLSVLNLTSAGGMLMGGAYLIGLLSLIFIVRPKTVPDLAN
jgi:autotransporter-associated beta strand protein